MCQVSLAVTNPQRIITNAAALTEHFTVFQLIVLVRARPSTYGALGRLPLDFNVLVQSHRSHRSVSSRSRHLFILKKMK